MNTSLKLFFVLALVIPAMLLGQSSPSKIAIVDVQKVFDDYYKVKEAMEKRTKSEKIFKDEMTIMENELKKLVGEFNEIQKKHRDKFFYFTFREIGKKWSFYDLIRRRSFHKFNANYNLFKEDDNLIIKIF